MKDASIFATHFAIPAISATVGIVATILCSQSAFANHCPSQCSGRALFADFAPATMSCTSQLRDYCIVYLDQSRTKIYCGCREVHKLEALLNTHVREQLKASAGDDLNLRRSQFISM